MSTRFAFLALPALLLTFAAGLHAQPAPGNATNATAAAAFAAMPDSAIVATRISLPDADIDTVLNTLELYTGKSVLRPAVLTVPPAGGFNVVRSDPAGITKGDVIRQIEMVLALNSIAVVHVDDKFIKVVPLNIARTESPPMITDSTFNYPSSGRVATKIFQLNFLTAQAFQNAISNLLTSNIGGAANAGLLASANAVMVTDTITSLQRIEKLVETLDKPVTSNLASKSILLKNARATTTLTQINNALTPAQLQQVGGRISADDRANQILVVGDPRIFPFYEDLISRYDVKADPNTKQEVFPLKSAIATDLILILNTIVNGSTQAAQRANAATVRPGTGVLGAGVFPQANAALPGTVAAAGAAPGGAGGAVPAVAAVAPAAPAGAAGGAAAGAAGATANEFSSLISMVADPRGNSIVVNGTADDVVLVRNLINKLDVQLPQVAIEVVIVEVSLSKQDLSGLQALNLTVGTDTPGGTVTADSTTGAKIVTPGTNLNRGTHITGGSASIGGWAVSGGTVNPLALTAALQDSGHRNNVKVLQNLTLTTSHNKAATFEATTQQPIVTGTTAATGTSAASSTVSYQNIGITLTATPQIGTDGSVQLTLNQVVDSVVSTTTIDANTQPIIGHRQANTFVNVKSGEMIALGGLRTSTRSNSRQKLGFIWEIPILSNLLGARDRSDDSTELLFFVRPRVIPGGAESADALKMINELSNKDDVIQYLKDPSKPAKDSLLELVK